MSYILDALKKSEKERQKKTAPDPLEVHYYVAYKPSKRIPLRVYVVSVVVILNIALLLYWGSPWQSKKTENGAVSTAEKSVVLSTPGSSVPGQIGNISQPSVIAG